MEPWAQGSGDVSNRFEMAIRKLYHGRVLTYGGYQKINTGKKFIQGLAFNCSLCGLDLGFRAKTSSKWENKGTFAIKLIDY